jgi:hypothetical protein
MNTTATNTTTAAANTTVNSRSWRTPVRGQKTSNWLITISLNKQPTPVLEQKFDECLQRIFAGNNINHFIDVLEGDPRTIAGLKVEVGADEISGKNGYLHNHNIVSIDSHNCKLQINYGRVRETIRECMSPVGVQSFHLDVKLLGNDKQKAIAYANKGVDRQN